FEPINSPCACDRWNCPDSQTSNDAEPKKFNTDQQHATSQSETDYICQNLQRGGLVIVRRNAVSSRAAAETCCELLDCLGVPYVQAPGEAESLCALMNNKDIVDACISNDGDSFLYGAKKVLRNFSTSVDKKACTVDTFETNVIHEKLNLSRKKLVLFALMRGCDYLQGGVKGFGKLSSIELVASLTNDEVDLLYCTLQSGEKDNIAYFVQKNKLWQRFFAGLKQCPVQEIFEEYLENEAFNRDFLPKRKDLVWRRPNMLKLMDFCRIYLDWSPDYILHHVLPLISRWDMRRLRFWICPVEYEYKKLVPMPDPERNVTCFYDEVKPHLRLEPLKVVKKRVVKFIPSYEIRWKLVPADMWTMDLKSEAKENVIIEYGLKPLDPYLFCVPKTEFEVAYPELMKELKDADLRLLSEKLDKMNIGSKKVKKGPTGNELNEAEPARNPGPKDADLESLSKNLDNMKICSMNPKKAETGEVSQGKSKQAESPRSPAFICVKELVKKPVNEFLKKAFNFNNSICYDDEQEISFFSSSLELSKDADSFFDTPVTKQRPLLERINCDLVVETT
ncbi:Flap endonuclease GEN 1, partial [Cichlidogyrus casuarinus]